MREILQTTSTAREPKSTTKYFCDRTLTLAVNTAPSTQLVQLDVFSALFTLLAFSVQLQLMYSKINPQENFCWKLTAETNTHMLQSLGSLHILNLYIIIGSSTVPFWPSTSAIMATIYWLTIRMIKLLRIDAIMRSSFCIIYFMKRESKLNSCICDSTVRARTNNYENSFVLYTLSYLQCHLHVLFDAGFC